jgi:hypothetical protein
MSLDEFWAAIEAVCTEVRGGVTLDRLLELCPKIPGISSGDGFFEGGGGDHDLLSALLEGGWDTVEVRASYYWCAKSPTGEKLSYVEGDLYRGNQLMHPA